MIEKEKQKEEFKIKKSEFEETMRKALGVPPPEGKKKTKGTRTTKAK